jgi:hypothetical protein
VSDELAKRIDERRAQQDAEAEAQEARDRESARIYQIVREQWEGPYKALNDAIKSANRTFVEKGQSYEFHVQQKSPDPLLIDPFAPKDCHARHFICHTDLECKRPANYPVIASSSLLSATTIVVWPNGRVSVEGGADLAISEINREYWDTLLADIYERDDDRK